MIVYEYKFDIKNTLLVKLSFVQPIPLAIYR